MSGTNLLAGTYGGGVFLSTNNGTGWTAVNAGLPPGLARRVSSFAMSVSNIFAGTLGGVFLSTDNGTNWTTVNAGLTNPDILSLVVSGTNLFAGTYPSGVFLSTNNGTNWAAVSLGLPTASVRSLAVFPNGVGGTNVLAGTDGDGVFLSSNNGANWTAVNSGLTSDVVFSFAMAGTNLFAGTGGKGVWRRPLSELTSVRLSSEALPARLTLDQNYPNPFNPATTISFSLPSASFVSLKVFDALGEEVSVLLAEVLPAGTYAQQWNATGLASGVYFYRLRAGDVVQTRRMLLLR